MEMVQQHLDSAGSARSGHLAFPENSGILSSASCNTVYRLCLWREPIRPSMSASVDAMSWAANPREGLMWSSR